MTTRQLVALTYREARRMRLSEWKIDVMFKPVDEMVRSGHDDDGLTFIDAEYQQVVIWVSKAIRHEHDRVRETVVHELLHVRLEGHRPQGRYDPAYELGLNVIAGLLARE